MDRRPVRVFDQQAAADKEARRLVRVAFRAGGTVPYSLGRLIELKLSLNVIRAVYRAPAE
jgi:hypothetical protein